MRQLRCKCGKREAWTTDNFQDCQGCPECGTTYAGHPDNHRPLQPHDWETKYNENTGKPYKRCKKCYEIDEESYKESKKKDTDDINVTPLLEENEQIKESSEPKTIPTNLDEALEILDNEENRKFAMEHQENDFLCELHFDIGMKLRNDWELWHGSSLAKWFNEKGIYHADDMSSIILLAYYRKVNNKDIMLDKQIKEYRNHWEKVDPDVNKGKIMKTYHDWEESGLDLTEFVQPGDEIDYEIYEHIGFALVGPIYNDGKILQCGECSFERDGVDYYMTAKEDNGKYFYLGELPDKNKSVKRIKSPSTKMKRRELQIGDPVRVMDPGLIMLQRFASPNSKPNNEGTVLEILDNGKTILVDFPIGDDDPKDHSQVAPYPVEMIRLKK